MDYAIENNQQIIVKLLFKDLKEKNSSMQNEIQQLRKQKESSEREISSQEEDIWKLKCKNRLSEREVTSREGQIRQLKDDSIISKRKIASQQEEILKIKKENSISKGEISSLEGQIKLLKEDNRMSNRKIASQQEEIQRLREENRLSKEKFASQQQKIKQLKNENKISKGRITPQLEEIKPPKNDNKILKEKFASQQEEIQRLEKENKEMTEKVETYKIYLTSLTEKPSDLHFFDINEYEEESVIGEGSTSRVKIVHKKEKYAIKELLLFDHKSMQRFLGECEILFNLRHPCIIRVYGFNIGDDTHKPSIILSLEPKSLDSAIRSKELDEEQRNRITVELVLGMRYIHKFKIMHRDLKPLNILLSKNNHVRIADFGLATEENFEVTQTKGVGTLLFMAPELFDDENENRYTNKVDVYSFGVVLIFIVTEKYPSNSIITGVFPKLPKEMPKSVHGLITNCLSRNPENRPSFADIFEIMKANNFDFFSDSKDKELTKNQQYMKKRIEARITKIEAFEFQHQ